MTDPKSAAGHSGLRRRTKAILIGLLLTPILIFCLFAWTSLHWDYSNGYRAGVLQKFSYKGWMCKTGEGEIAQAMVPGVAPTIWDFSVRSEPVAHQLDSLVGKKVRLHYREHRGVPTSCFGETSYFVDSAFVVAE